MLPAIIGGSGFYEFEALEAQELLDIPTPYGPHSKPLIKGRFGDANCVFIPRHGRGHKIPPHKINYRANLWALKQLKVSDVIAINAVGGISAPMAPGALVLPDQLIDYTYGRDHTFFDGVDLARSFKAGPNKTSSDEMRSEKLSKDFGDQDDVASRESQSSPIESFSAHSHIDFTEPYSPDLRKKILKFFLEERVDAVASGVCACVQGPRLEAAAEIERFKRDGCDLVGMTTMPEAALARELGIHYVGLMIVANWAAGVEKKILSLDEIMKMIESNMAKIKGFLPRLIKKI